MICYRDMTFCPFYIDCKKGKKCERALTEEVRQKAAEWLEDPPICVFANKPDCFQRK
jgi:hypothetical protein